MSQLSGLILISAALGILAACRSQSADPCTKTFEPGDAGLGGGAPTAVFSVLAVLPSGPGPDVVPSQRFDFDSLNRLLDSVAEREVPQALVRIILDSSLPVRGPFERLWAADLLARREGGADLIDTGLGVIARDLTVFRTIDANTITSLSALSHSLRHAVEGRRTHLLGTEFAVCSLRQVRSVVALPTAADAQWMPGAASSILTRGAADLIVALERHDTSWSRESTEAMLARWNGLIDVDSLRSLLDTER